MFDGTLGTWKTYIVDLKLKGDAKPICLRPYSVPKVHGEVIKKEVDSLVLQWVIEVENDSEWGAPSFAQRKTKSNHVRFSSDFRNINKQLKRKPYPTPKIIEMLFKLEGFQYATSLDLKMVLYHIRLSKNARNLCMIILPWEKIATKVYQWKLISPNKFSNRR